MLLQDTEEAMAEKWAVTEGETWEAAWETSLAAEHAQVPGQVNE